MTGGLAVRLECSLHSSPPCHSVQLWCVGWICSHLFTQGWLFHRHLSICRMRHLTQGHREAWTTPRFRTSGQGQCE